MHQTVREFLLDYGHVAHSQFNRKDRDVHTAISITCMLYLMLVCADANGANLSNSFEEWDESHFEHYARLLDQWPLAAYALSNIQHHIHWCLEDHKILHILSQLTDQLRRGILAVLVPPTFPNQTPRFWEMNSVSPTKARGFGSRLLLMAAKNGFYNTAKIILESPNLEVLNVNSKDARGRTALSWAAGNGHIKTARLLAQEGAIVDEADKLGRTPLLWAAENGHITTIRGLIELGATINHIDETEETSLSWARSRGHIAVVELLMQHGADETLFEQFDHSTSDDGDRQTLALPESGADSGQRRLTSGKT